MIEIPSVEHESVEDSRSAHVMNGGPFVRVLEHRATQNDKGEEIEDSPGNDECERIVDNEEIICSTMTGSGRIGRDRCCKRDIRHPSRILPLV